VDGSVWPVTPDASKGIKLYDASVDQVSIVGLVNLNAELAMAKYGDRLDMISDSKSTQPVIVTNGLSGYPAAYFIKNWFRCDYIAGITAGLNKPLMVGIAAKMQNAADHGVVWAMSRAADATIGQQMLYADSGSWNMLKYGTATAKGVLDGATTTNHESIIYSSTGTLVSLNRNGIDVVTDADIATDACNSNVSRFGCLASGGVYTDYWHGIMRLIAIAATSADAKQRPLISNLFRIQAPY
jgi:hypothetical protein